MSDYIHDSEKGTKVEISFEEWYRRAEEYADRKLIKIGDWETVEEAREQYEEGIRPNEYVDDLLKVREREYSDHFDNM